MNVVVVTRIEGGIPEIIHVSDSIANARKALGEEAVRRSADGVGQLWEEGYYLDSDVEWRVDVATMDPAAFERMGAERYGGLFALMLAAHKHNVEADA